MSRKNTKYDVFKKINMHKGDHNVCWEWEGKLNKKDGRPYITIDGKRRPVYAVVLEIFKGDKADGRLTCHSCDVEICCNPHHLRFGTHQDNMDDMVARERHGLGKTVVRAIKKLRTEGKSQQEIATLYGVSRECISSIDTGRRRE
jgi:DNA-binding XRE family transcriptional regulator